MDWGRVCVCRDRVRQFSGHGPFQSLLPALPVGQHLVEEIEEGCPVIGFGHVAELVGDHVVDGIDRRLHQTGVQQQASRRRHGPPSLSDLAHDEPLRPECLGIREQTETEFDPLRKLDVGPVRVCDPDSSAGERRRRSEPTRPRQLRLSLLFRRSSPAAGRRDGAGPRVPARR